MTDADATNIREREKKQEIMSYLRENIFNPILNSPDATDALKRGIRLTIMRMEERDSIGIVHYYWAAVQGTDRSIEFARHMRAEGFVRFEEIIDEFRDRFGDRWLRS